MFLKKLISNQNSILTISELVTSEIGIKIAYSFQNKFINIHIPRTSLNRDPRVRALICIHKCLSG